MSSQYSSEATFHCGNDCRQQGCPGHTLKIHYHNTSDTVSIIEDGKLLHVYDSVQFRTMLRLATENDA